MSTAQRPSRMRTESGSIIILTALSMFVVLGILAFAVDASFLYTERNRLAAAADAAAKSAAIENYRSPGSPLQPFANRAVAAHGFDPGGTTTVSVHNRPSAGPYAGNSNYVEVVVSRPTGTFFSSILGGMWTSVTPVTRAVAGPSPSPTCVLTLDQTGAPSLNVGGSVTINAGGCDFIAAGNMNVSGSIVASAIGVQGTCSGCPGEAHTGIAGPSDPLANLSEPAGPAALGYFSPDSRSPYTRPPGQPADTLGPGWYEKIDIGPGNDVTLAPGVYWISGPISVGSSSLLHGSEVTLFLAGPGFGTCTLAATAGCLLIQDLAALELTAPTVGANRGIVIVKSITNSIEDRFLSRSNHNFAGLVYEPNASLTLGNSLSANDCSLFVAKSIDFAGNSTSMTLNNTCASFGGSPLRTLSLAE